MTPEEQKKLEETLRAAHAMDMRERMNNIGPGVDAIPDDAFAQAQAAAQKTGSMDFTQPSALGGGEGVDLTVRPAVGGVEEDDSPSDFTPERDTSVNFGNLSHVSAPPLHPEPPPAQPLEQSFMSQVSDYLSRMGQARAADAENVNRFNLGEGLKQAFAIARGQSYSPQHYSGPLQETGLKEDEATRRSAIADYLAKQRQGAQDELNRRHTEADIGLKKAETEKALRPPEKKAGEFDETSFREALKAEYPNAKKERGVDFDALHGKDALESAKATLEADKNRATQIEAAREQQARQLGFEHGEREKDREERQAGELAKSGKNAAAAARLLDSVESTLAKNPGHTAGAGGLESRIPDIFQSDEGVQLQQNLRDAIDLLLRERSGANAPEAEVRNYMRIYGANGSESQLREGMKRLRQDFAAELAQSQAGASPEAKQLFQQRGGTTAEQVRQPAGKVKVSNGKETYLIPKSRLADAQRDGFKVVP